MYAYINAEGSTVGLRVVSGWGEGQHVKLAGATFSVVPTGTFVERLSIEVPDGLHALAFFCRVEGPHRMGSGPTAYLEHNPKLSSKMLLAWRDDDKVILKADDDLTASELSKFNAFVRSGTDILVVDPERKTAYVSALLPRDAVDPSWTYKLVSMDAILEYITRKLTMEELDGRATSEQRNRDELQELRGRNRDLQHSVDVLQSSHNLLEEQCATAKTVHDTLIGMLKKSEGLYKFLKRVPTRFRPKLADGFVEAMDSLN